MSDEWVNEPDGYPWYDAYHSPGEREPEPRNIWYDRESRPITMKTYMTLYGVRNYVIVRKTNIRRYTVSTVWLGYDHSFTRYGSPVLFETMIFIRNGPPTHYGRRACTEKDAWKMHYDVCRMVHSGWRVTQEN